MKHFFLIATLSLFTAFTLLTFLVKKDVLRQADFNATVRLQDNIPKRFDDNLVHVVDLGSMEIQTVLILIAIIVAPVSKKTKLLLLGAYGAGLFITLLGKTFLPQPAPAFLLQRGSIGFAFPSSHVQVDASYPSGHTYRVVFLSALLFGSTWLSKSKRTVFAIASFFSSKLTVLVMIALVLLGKHWVTDVLGGLFLASSLVAFCFTLEQSLFHSKKNRARI